jgi:hypothetical protein
MEFWIVLIAFSGLWTFFEWAGFGFRKNDNPLKMLFAVCCVGCAAAFVMSFHVAPQAYENTKVVADFVGFQASDLVQVRAYTRTRETNTFAVYSVHGEHVLIRTRPGVAHPKRAILYRNIKTS